MIEVFKRLEKEQKGNKFDLELFNSRGHKKPFLAVWLLKRLKRCQPLKCRY